MNIISIFGKHQIQPGNKEILQLGCINLHAHREKQGWYLYTTEIGNEAEISDLEINKGNDFFQTGKSNSLIIEPALPSKPMVFKGAMLNVLPRQRLTFFLKIPLSMHIYTSKKLPENLLKEVVYKKLSDTWFGEPDNGEAAFALQSEYFLDFDKIETSECEAICPITVFNNSPKNLSLQRLIIRNDFIALYKNENKIVCSEVLIEYKGNEVMSSADYRYNKTYNGVKQDILSAAQNTSSKNLLKMNFHFIRTIYRGE